MNWAAKRRLQYMGGFLGVFFIIISFFLYPIIFKEPTCTDNKQNGTEIGIDCGGSCNSVCIEKTTEPLILWNRAFRVTDNAYNLVAFIENTNRDSAISNISYEFLVYDVNNRLIGRRKGNTYIPPNKQFVIFEPAFDPGEADLKSISFKFEEPYKWLKKEPTLDALPIFVDSIILNQAEYSPSLRARIKNESIYDIPSFEVVTILYDENHNAINVSKTFRDGLSSNKSLPIFFTWPQPFLRDPVIKDILIQINPFDFYF